MSMKPETSINQDMNFDYEEISEGNQESVTRDNQLLSKEKLMGTNLRKKVNQLVIATFGVICAANYVIIYTQGTYNVQIWDVNVELIVKVVRSNNSEVSRQE
ncbi:MAG: hypothetical protein F6K47_10460 [Symploca sp. SIO2E6]|nr:hypothetical protein [Symploca sp. SIO2E6]